ncbi:ABC transporter permease [Haladaptatus cibarius]|uniref:ABC transporter permease n=1 Tax=Haladaptatus cibarius TaxID=453847 RepID=UPI00067935C3|nr:FtsX-like permease family protein [Haladaptatus cibarius]
MNLFESLRISWRNIREHKLRSTLTTLGVIIGVAAVITFVTLGASLQADIISTVAGGNAATMYVSAQSQSETGLPDIGGGGQTVLTKHDMDGIRSLQGVEAAVPESGVAASTVEFNNSTVGRQWVVVTTPPYFDVRNQDFVSGGSFQSGEREVVLNRPAVSMFGEENVTVGDNITVTRAAGGERVNATVVGIVEPTDQSALGISEGASPQIYAPTDPFYQRTVYSPSANENQRVYGRALVLAESPSQVDSVQGRVYTYLGEQSDARELKSDSYRFKVTTQDELVNQVRQVSNTFTAYITGIALISLVVGAIGIANIMLVSVTERTREIGIMKAVGARNNDVLQLFLFEAVLLGLFGSAVGALVGLGGGYVAASIIGLPLAFRPEWFGIAVAVGVLVGVLAGIYPAWDAAQTDPIDALRYE